MSGVTRLCIAGLLAALAPAAAAAPVEPVAYATAADLTTFLADFEALPPLPEPGHNLDHGYAFPGGRVGERFAGQGLAILREGDGAFDLAGPAAPAAPLALVPGAPFQGLSVSFHRAFGSNALYPLGPVGWPAPEGRGEGMAAFLFDEDACAVALRIHTEYVDDLGTGADHRGRVTLVFHRRDGQTIHRVDTLLPAGITALGFRRAGGLADIAGVLVMNADRGGISLDDVRFGCALRLG